VYAVSDRDGPVPTAYLHEASKFLGGGLPGGYSDRSHAHALRLLDKAIELAEADQ
jgi:hypothetical protein